MTCSATTGTRVARDPHDLEAAAGIGRIAGERALARLGARRLTTRKAPVAFTPDLARGLFRHFVGAISGTEPVPQVLVPARCRRRAGLPEVPLDAGATAHPEGPRQQSLRRGRARRRTIASWCATGVLEGYVLGSYSARRLGLKTTGNAGGIHNLIVSGADAALERARRS